MCVKVGKAENRGISNYRLKTGGKNTTVSVFKKTEHRILTRHNKHIYYHVPLHGIIFSVSLKR
jgi:hypothetical protein